ncbi:helix-loop-helix protein 13-like [Watersipora subatra]|uniref:helix-loop-helix protein 13-like n=1 Tax=Watersipora subatra TaxID=2589382 RepID=UPI00355C014A
MYHLPAVEEIEPTVELNEAFDFTDYLVWEHDLPSFQSEDLFFSEGIKPVSQPRKRDHFAVDYIASSAEACQGAGIHMCATNETKQKVNVGENREKKRLNSINSAFERLKEVIPTFPFEKRLTKMETLRLAISYMTMLQELIESDMKPEQFMQKVLQGDLARASWYTQELSARLNWLHWENLGMCMQQTWQLE